MRKPARISFPLGRSPTQRLPSILTSVYAPSITKTMPLDKQATGIDPSLIIWFDSIDSTMFEAARLAQAGARSGTIVGADEQTAGQGRQGHSWYSEREA